MQSDKEKQRTTSSLKLRTKTIEKAREILEAKGISIRDNTHAVNTILESFILENEKEKKKPEEI